MRVAVPPRGESVSCRADRHMYFVLQDGCLTQLPCSGSEELAEDVFHLLVNGRRR